MRFVVDDLKPAMSAPSDRGARYGLGLIPAIIC